MKERTGELVDLAFSARHIGMSIWVLMQNYTGTSASFWENVAAAILFYTPAAKTMKFIFEDFAGELSAEEYKALVVQLKVQKHAYLVFLLWHPLTVTLHTPLGNPN